MADRVLFIGWGETVRGREERALEVFNESIGLLGRMQQDGAIERFDVVLLGPNPDLAGYIEIHGTGEQLGDVCDDPRFQRNTADAALVVERLRHIEGYTDAGVGRQLVIYQDAIAKVPQRT